MIRVPAGYAADVTLPLVGVVLFVLVVMILAAAIRRSNPRPKVNVVRSDPPIRQPGDTAYTSRRARAAAAAIVYHRKRHASGEIHENR